MVQIADGKEIADKILDNLQARVQKLNKKGIKPALAVVLVGDNKPSQTYVKKKGEAAEKIGLAFFKFAYPKTIGKEELIAELKKIQSDYELSGLILQLPIPENLRAYTRQIVNNIKIEIDVDCLSHLALGRVMMNESPLVPPTPGAIMEILKHYQVDLQGKEVCLVGRGDLIGKPLAAMLADQPVTLVVCGKSTPDLSVYTKRADIIISGVGKKDLITGAMIKEGGVVIDAGVSFEGDKMFGDINFESVQMFITY